MLAQNSRLKQLQSVLFNFIFENRCTSCDRLITNDALCDSCQKSIKLTPPQLCSICAAPLEYQFRISSRYTHFCLKCRELEIPFDEIQTPFVYENPFKSLILGLKFKNKRELATEIVERSYKYFEPLIDELDNPIIIPTPLSFRKIFSRGYNHAYLLGLEVAKRGNLSIDSQSLIRKKHTKPQFSLSNKNRRKNVKDAFALTRTDLIKNRDLILVDDVYTTGATIFECAKVLQNGSPNTISVLAICRSI